jgi:myosin heavy subunit
MEKNSPLHSITNLLQIGKTKLFLTDGIIQQIDKANEEILKKIVISQSGKITPFFTSSRHVNLSFLYLLF